LVGEHETARPVETEKTIGDCAGLGIARRDRTISEWAAVAVADAKPRRNDAVARGDVVEFAVGGQPAPSLARLLAQQDWCEVGGFEQRETLAGHYFARLSSAADGRAERLHLDHVTAAAPRMVARGRRGAESKRH